MTARPIDPTVGLDRSLPQILEAALAETLKRVNVALPANVLAYDPTTRRATIQPLLHLLLDDDTTVPRAPVVDVPVVWPGIGDVTIHGTLRPGVDQVLLIFAHRDMSGWKTGGAAGGPPTDRIMSEADAFALPGVNTAAGGTVTVGSDTTSITITEGQVTINSGLVVINHANGTETWGN